RACCCHPFFFSSRRRHTRSKRDWSSDVCSSDLTLRTDDLQTAGLSRHIVQLDIRTTARHVGGDGNGARLSGLSDDLRLQFMELEIGRASCRERVGMTEDAVALSDKGAVRDDRYV